MSPTSFKLNSQQFTWVKDSKTFVAEASDLGMPPGPVPLSVTLVSAKTGVEAVFSAAQVITDDDNDVLAFIYRSPTVDAEVHILND